MTIMLILKSPGIASDPGIPWEALRLDFDNPWIH